MLSSAMKKPLLPAFGVTAGIYRPAILIIITACLRVTVLLLPAIPSHTYIPNRANKENQGLVVMLLLVACELFKDK